MPSNLLSVLNPDQQRVVTATDGPVLVLAGAGSGKTKALTHRIAYLLEQGKAAPEEIMAVTFTNKAAREMRERVAALLGSHFPTPTALGTFHGLGAKILRTHHRHTTRSAGFSILDSADSKQLIKRALTSLDLSPKEWDPRTIQNQISRAKNALQSPAALSSTAQSGLEEIVARVYERYQTLLKQNDAYDFDDLIAEVITLLHSQSQIRTHYQECWRYVSVDEYQDTNAAQEQLLQLLLNQSQNLCVVGDDYQAIYSWRGARVDHILKFEKSFPGCTTIYLTQNYRSTPAILQAANQVISENKEQKHKKLWTGKSAGPPVMVAALPTDRIEATWVRQHIEEHIASGGRAADCAVLYRTNAQSRLLEEQFIMYQLPYTIVGGFRFYDRLEIKDAMALLQWWVNPASNVALHRLSRTCLRGIGPKTLQQLEKAAALKQIPIATLLTHAEALTPRQRLLFQPLLHAYATARNQNFSTVAELLEFLVTHSGYGAYLKAQPDGQERLENIEELYNVAAQATEPTRFVEEVALLSDIDEMKEAHDRITCMTLHAAKGLEFPHVYIVGCEEGLLPHNGNLLEPAALAEERRLLYVGITRAQQQLILTYALTRTLRGETLPQIPSRFLKNLPDSVTHLRDTPLQPQAAWQDFGLITAPSSTEESLVVAEAGEYVSHPIFGRGVVIQVSGSLLTCVFPTHGVKTIDGSKVSMVDNF